MNTYYYLMHFFANLIVFGIIFGCLMFFIQRVIVFIIHKKLGGVE